MEEKYIVFRILRKTEDGSYIIDGQTKNTLDEAKHHFHSVMNTYAYGANAAYDYAACQIQSLSGGIVMGPEVDNRIPVPEPVEE